MGASFGAGAAAGRGASTRSFRKGVAAAVKRQPWAATVSRASAGSHRSWRMSGAPVCSARRAPWIAPTLCPSGEGMKIGESGPSPKRSANVTFRAASVSAVCMTAFGRPVVLDVNMRWSSPSTGGAGPAPGPLPAASEPGLGPGPGLGQRRVPSSATVATAGGAGHRPAAARATSPVSIRPFRSTVMSTRTPHSSTA